MKARILSLFLVASGSLGMGAHQSFAAVVFYGTDIFTDQLITIDPVTGAGTAVGSLGFPGVFGLAYVPEAVVIPEPSSTLLFGLGALGLLARRRRH